MDTQQISTLEEKLNDFDLQTRTDALQALLALAEQGTIQLPPPVAVANMHCHTFFSFNAYGHSPSSLAWLGKRQGYKLMGIVDFDVLDGVDEFLDAAGRGFLHPGEPRGRLGRAHPDRNPSH